MSVAEGPYLLEKQMQDVKRQSKKCLPRMVQSAFFPMLIMVIIVIMVIMNYETIIKGRTLTRVGTPSAPHLRRLSRLLHDDW